jgi:hypothetical protein
LASRSQESLSGGRVFSVQALKTVTSVSSRLFFITLLIARQVAKLKPLRRCAVGRFKIYAEPILMVRSPAKKARTTIVVRNAPDRGHHSISMLEENYRLAHRKTVDGFSPR